MFNRKSALCATLLVAGLTSARAGTIFDNIGPGFPGDSPIGYESIQSYLGTSFIATGSGPLLQVINDAFDETSSLTVTAGLYTNSGGEPGALLESWNVALPAFDTLTTLNSVLHPVLTAGSQYWLVYGPNAINLQWSGNDEGIIDEVWTGPTLTGLSGGADPQLGLELVSSTPEPATGVLLSGALAALLGLRHSRRRLGHHSEYRVRHSR